ncbi:hypothetical protein DL96DRAFT_1638057 [Flagelloscypha sp. PMI_526]|nr:hypothetical protein DL96DRAFT_1638057 [Flagelloscypha sp. PMI_526]
MLPLQYGLLGGGNALPYLWNPGVVTGVPHHPSLARPQMHHDVQDPYSVNVVPPIPYTRQVTMTQTLASLHRAVSALSPTYPLLWDLRGRYLFLQVSTSLNLLLAVKAGSPGNLAVANEPTPRASTNSSSVSSSRQLSLGSSKRPQWVIRRLEPVPLSVNP